MKGRWRGNENNATGLKNMKKLRPSSIFLEISLITVVENIDVSHKIYFLITTLRFIELINVSIYKISFKPVLTY